MPPPAASLDVSSRQTLTNVAAAKMAVINPGCGVSALYILATVVSLPLVLAYFILTFICTLVFQFADVALCRCAGYGSKSVTPADGCVVVTGASGGIGMEIARGYADLGFNLVLVARSENKLNALATELRALGRTVHVVVCDLGKTGAATELFYKVKECGVEVAILVNNAGVGFGGPFFEQEVEKLRSMTGLNMVSLMELTHAFGKEMVNRGKGKIMNVSSIASFAPGPLEATYHASKSFVTSLTRAINYELRGTGVSVTAVCPGFTESDFFESAGMKPFGAKIPCGVQSSRNCALQAIAATATGKSWAMTGNLCGALNHALAGILTMGTEGYVNWLVNLLWH